MRLGPLQLARGTAARVIAAVVASFLLAGNVLAAAGLCVIQSPGQPVSMHAAQAACPDHVPDSDELNARHLCPAEDASFQARSLDLPAPQLMAAVAASVSYLVQSVSTLQPAVVADRAVPPPPLYARLQRLRL